MSRPLSKSLRYSLRRVYLSYSLCPVKKNFLLSLLFIIEIPHSSPAASTLSSSCAYTASSSTVVCLDMGMCMMSFIPRNSGSAVANLTWRQWGLNYSFIYVGERYNQQENIRYNYTQPWYTSDLSLSRDFSINRVRMRALLEVNNLLSQDYDVIINYPMPKRNWRVNLTIEI